MEMQENSASMEVFKARSGREVKALGEGTVMFTGAHGYLNPAAAMDAAEYFQATRDRELGRWRWSVNPDYVVYRSPESDEHLAVLDERDGEYTTVSISWAREALAEGDTPDLLLERAAIAFVAENPTQKPWEDAKHGEVWEVTHTGEQVDLCRVNGWKRFEQVSGTGTLVSMPVTHHSITAARKVWPEDAS